ncbi:MarP family serine protease [Granulicoccus sp. GXG6511]|uniref:MarP family serine protease n=1 Tax=Granulicoccus sp. GXG6511 TaxID=3381351 RepID=UPI003D7DD406
MDLVTGALVLDIILVAVLLMQAITGWYRGFLASALGVAGLIAGGWIAIWGLPQMMAPTETFRENAIARAVVMLFGVLLLASLGYGLLSDAGRRIMAGRRTGVLGRGDSLAGSLLSAAMAAVLLGLASLALYPLSPASWRGLMDESKVLSTISDNTPPAVVDFAARATSELYDAGFPRVFGDPATEPDLPADSPDAQIVNNPGVRAAADSIVKVNSSMVRCNAAGTGTGWVVSPQRIVTNAHVVAGSNAVTVQVGGTGARLSAQVVGFDPDLDLAILEVPRLRAEPLARAAALHRGDSAVVAGFPRGGPYRVESARVRGTLTATGNDIYDSRPVQREIYSIYARVIPGNSGGPLLTESGEVAGTIFARSGTSVDTGFVITNAGSAQMLDEAANLTQPVSTGNCAA